MPGLLASIDGISAVISDDRRSRFCAKSEEALAQRVGSPLLIGPADASWAQGRDRFRMTERHCDAMRPWEAALPRPCLERARDMGRTAGAPVRSSNWPTPGRKR
jgi:hypothetical protein